MLRNAKFMHSIFRIQVRSVVHVGADKGQDRRDYLAIGASEIFWCEADPNSVDYLQESFHQDCVISGIFWDIPDKEIDFYQCSTSALSSAIEFSASTATEIQNIIKLRTKTLSKEFENRLLVKPILLNLDVQGAELKVLSGASGFLPKVKYVICEIALEDQGYTLKPKEEEVDKILSEFGFRKSISRFGYEFDYKDQLYIKSSPTRILVIALLDQLLDLGLRIRHLIMKRHWPEVHYHCESCRY